MLPLPQVDRPRPKGFGVSWRVEADGTTIQTVGYPLFVDARDGRDRLEGRYPEYTWRIVRDERAS